MDYQELSMADRRGLLTQRLQQHEQAHFEIEMQIMEVESVMPEDTSSDEYTRLKEQRIAFIKQRDRLDVLRRTVARALTAYEQDAS